MNKFFMISFLVIISSIFFTGIAPAKENTPSFVAEMMMRDENGRITEGLFYFQNSTYRYTFKDNGQKYYLIVKIEEPEGIFVNPDEKLYSRMDKATMAMAGNVIEVLTVAESFVTEGLYEVASEAEEEYQGLKCTKKIYSLKYKEPSGLSAEELKAAEIWIAQEYNLPIKITTYQKGKEVAQFELRNIKEKELDPSLFSIPPGFKEMKLQGKPRNTFIN